MYKSDGLKPVCGRCSKHKKECKYERKSDPNFVPIKRARKEHNSKPYSTQSDSSLGSQNLISNILHNFVKQQKQQNQDQIQLKNSSLQQLVSSFGIENANSELLPFSICPPEPRIFHSSEELPYPPAIIDDMVNSYFSNLAHWPKNFMHSPSFIENRYRIPRALLAIVCARGSKYSKFTPFLSTQADVSRVLLNYAKKHFNHEDVSLNGLIINVQFALFYKEVGSPLNGWVYISSFLTLIRLLELYEDPDELSQKNGLRFNPIEKEIRRRVWWSLRIISLSPISLLKEFPINRVRIPLPSEHFESLSEIQEVAQEITLFPYEKFRTSAVETIGFELMLWREKIILFHEKVCRQQKLINDFFEILIQATTLQTDFQQWFNYQPEWFKTALESDNIHVSKMHPKNSDQIPWIAVNLAIMFHTLSMFPYRFLLIYISGSLPLNEHSKEFIAVSNEFCRKTQKKLLHALKTCIIRLDPRFSQFHLMLLFSIAHSAIFSSVMSQFDETEKLRSDSKEDYEFLISCLRTVAVTAKYPLIELVVKNIEVFHKTPPGEQKIEYLHVFFTESMLSQRGRSV
ncbi:hypothetical protein HK096_006744 [Nowakowskiella sp. JEL0078]|nr:hypothetical protein HK096_006744 [Nowakowskiella sp. JEL0078]